MSNEQKEQPKSPKAKKRDPNGKPPEFKNYNNNISNSDL